jgi:hypothetical protein
MDRDAMEKSVERIKSSETVLNVFVQRPDALNLNRQF